MIAPDGVYYMLDGVEDPYNFGYSVRSIYAAGGSGIILSPRNWMGVAGVVARSSAGSSELIDMFVSEPEEAVDLFKSLGYKIICAGIRDSESIFDTDLQKPLFVVLGGEKRGISRAILDKADTVVRIDYGNDFNGSLSTAAASAVFAFEIFRANR
jgi:23S rRNA (guanosine2251-2'-O)-methyltransferase